MTIPKQYLPVMPYIILHDAKAFATFLQKVFDATEQLLVPAPDDKLMHAEMRVSDGVIMFASAHAEWKEKTAGMFVYVTSVDTVYAKAMAEGAESLMTPQQQEYGYTAGFNDPFGNQWWLVQGEE